MNKFRVLNYNLIYLYFVLVSYHPKTQSSFPVNQCISVNADQQFPS